MNLLLQNTRNECENLNKRAGGFSLEFKTIEHWDEEVWKKWRDIYHEAFGEKGGKPEKVLRNMFQKQMCFFHIAQHESEASAIALSGKLQGTRMLLIDYLAVREKERNCGMGERMVDYIKRWSRGNENVESIVIEVEAEQTAVNLARIRFWKKCGFTLTDYIHHYKVVPEPYQAMFCTLVPEAEVPQHGEALFSLIETFHRKSFRDVVRS
jgi:GNAT superfamily N-acetyltransferase